MLPFLFNLSDLLFVLLNNNFMSVVCLVPQALNDCSYLSVTLLDSLITKLALKLLHLLLLLAKELVFPLFLFNLRLFLLILKLHLMSPLSLFELLVKGPSLAY